MDVFERIGYHARALGASIIESTADAVKGVDELLSKTAPQRADDIYIAAKDALGPIGAVVAPVIWPLAYAVNVTFVPTGEAIGNGLGMIAVHRNGEEVAMGAASLISGGCAAVGLAVSSFLPRPAINIPVTSFSMGSGGAMAVNVGMTAVSMPVGETVGAAISGIAGGGTMCFSTGRDSMDSRPIGKMTRGETLRNIREMEERVRVLSDRLDRAKKGNNSGEAADIKAALDECHNKLVRIKAEGQLSSHEFSSISIEIRTVSRLSEEAEAVASGIEVELSPIGPFETIK